MKDHKCTYTAYLSIQLTNPGIMIRALKSFNDTLIETIYSRFCKYWYAMNDNALQVQMREIVLRIVNENTKQEDK